MTHVLRSKSSLETDLECVRQGVLPYSVEKLAELVRRREWEAQASAQGSRPGDGMAVQDDDDDDMDAQDLPL